MHPTSAGGYPRRPLALTDVQIHDSFWSPRQEQIHTKTLWHQEEMLHRTGQFGALSLNWRPGDPNEPHIFWESDVAKWLEAASYCLAQGEDAELDAAVDRVIDLLAGAQQPDGYLNVYFTLVRPDARFTDLRDAHELYCAGHLIEAGVAHYQATGKETLLTIVRRYADLLVQVFGPGGQCEGGYDGHQEIELALVKLYRVTGDRRYLDLSKKMIDDRGTQPFYYEREAERRGTPGYFESAFPQREREPQRFREYNQSHLPIREQDAIVGHSVRAMYHLSAVTDLAAEYDDGDLLAAARRLWRDMADTKLYITGGLGADPSIEGFAAPYELPNLRGYAETCAAIGLVQWAQRMGNLTGEGQFVDVLERALYNGVLSGASADGTHYFYGNPLASDGDVHRHEWFGCACCPPNLARLISELGRYLYAQGKREAVVNLYASSTARFDFDGAGATIRQETSYPRDGVVEISVIPENDGEAFALALHIPSWAAHTARINGVPFTASPVDGYLRIDREWHAGDTVTLDLCLSPRRTWSNLRVAENLGKVALELGPIVYCLEGVDHTAPVATLTLPRSAEITASRSDDADMVVLQAHGRVEQWDDGALYCSEPPATNTAELRAVPYATWGNRGQSDMTVWIRETVER